MGARNVPNVLEGSGTRRMTNIDGVDSVDDTIWLG
jgi:hypothetical protein